VTSYSGFTKAFLVLSITYDVTTQLRRYFRSTQGRSHGQVSYTELRWNRTKTVDSTNRKSFVPEVKYDVICTDWRETKKFSAVLRGDLPSVRRHCHWVDLCWTGVCRLPAGDELPYCAVESLTDGQTESPHKAFCFTL